MSWQKRLPDGRWRAFESAGSRGQRLQASAIRATQREAKRAALLRLEEKLRRAALEPHDLTLAAYLARWTEHLATQERSGKNLARYESVCKQLPAPLARTKLADLRPLALQQYLDSRSKGEAAATVRKRYNILHAALAAAVSWRLIAENPMAAVRTPKVTRPEPKALDEPATVALLGKLSGTRYEAAATVAVTTGLRRGELLALRWRDLDLPAATLAVARSVDEVAGKPLAFKAPKGGKRRQVALMAATVSALKAHKARQAAAKLKAKKWQEHGLVFPTRSGAPWRPSTFSVGWHRLVPDVRFHELRHTHATLLLRAGVPVDAVAKRLGHASPVVTMTVYAHVLEDADAAAVDRLEAGLGKMLPIPTTLG